MYFLGFYHEEHWQDAQTIFPYHAHVGLAISHNRGLSWEKKGPIITGQEVGSFDSGRAFGAGQPSAILINGDLYVYYVDWNSTSPDSIHLAKAPLEDIDDVLAWKKWNGSGFESSGIGGTSVPVVVPANNEAYAALPAMSFNTKLGKYLGVYETDLGFYTSTSSDGIAWSPGLQILSFDRPQWTIPKNEGESWISYPTFLSNTGDSSITNGSGKLFYSRGNWAKSPHTMVNRSMSLT